MATIRAWAAEQKARRSRVTPRERFRRHAGRGWSGWPNVAEPAACGSCGRTLPAQRGRGRRRRYCDDACRSRAMRARNPAPPACQLRLGGWPCERTATGYVRERDPERNRFKPWGFSVAACEVCAPLAEAFADSLGLTTGRQTLEEFRNRQPAF